LLKPKVFLAFGQPKPYNQRDFNNEIPNEIWSIMMIRTNKASLLSSALVATALFSGTTSASDKIGFNGNGELGLSSTSGNTENDSLYASLIVGYKREWMILRRQLKQTINRKRIQRLKKGIQLTISTIDFIRQTRIISAF